MGKISKKSNVITKIKKPKVKSMTKSFKKQVFKPTIAKNQNKMLSKIHRKQHKSPKDNECDDEFIEEGVLENDSEENISDDSEINDSYENETHNSDDSEINNPDDSEINKSDDEEEAMFNADSDNEDNINEVHNHKAALQRLQKTDPEFYNFLQENDKKLLQFNVSDSEDESDTEDKEEDDDVHQPGELEVASDESDYEETDETKKQHITLKLIKQFQNDLQVLQKTNNTIIEVTKAFNAALRSVADVESSGTYIVKGSGVFNGVIQVCVLYLGPAVRNFLQLKKGQQAHKSKRFTKIKSAMRQYFVDLLALLSNVTSGNILNVLLKHLHYMTPILVSFPNCGKNIVKKLILLWSSAPEESVRVLAFLCNLRLVNLQREALLDYALKTMYIAYVKNSKFVSVNTLPSVNFMRRSLVEMYALDLTVAYQHVFLYIRQLAINLRNAIVDNKRENIHVVYNWQYVNSCRLWGNLLGQTANRPQLQTLIYPFVQVCLGTLKLVPTAAYFPLRFHLVQILTDLCRDSGVYVPVLPFLAEILTTFDFNKKHTKISMKPITFTTSLRMGKAQMSENGFKDAIIESVYAGLLEYLAVYSHSVAFPDLALFVKCQIKHFLKKCTIAKYQRKLQQLLEKIEQNVAHIEEERAKLTVNLVENKKIEGFEAQIKNRGTPLGTFYESWNKVRNIKRSKHATNNEEIGEYNLPVLKKHKNGKMPRSNVESDGKVVLFPSDSEDDTEKEKQPKKKRGKRAGRKEKAEYVKEKLVIDNDQGDIIQNIADW